MSRRRAPSCRSSSSSAQHSAVALDSYPSSFVRVARTHRPERNWRERHGQIVWLVSVLLFVCGCYGLRRSFAALACFPFCLGCDYLECGDPSPLFLYGLMRSASGREKQAKAAKDRRTLNSHTQGRKGNKPERRRIAAVHNSHTRQQH